MASNNYDVVAKYYDLISQLVYGNKIIKAQEKWLHLIPKKSKILIVGGGTGKILDSINKLTHAASLAVVFVDASAEMIRIAQKRNLSNLDVVFVNERIENFRSETSFDVLMTPFFFDNFDRPKIDVLFPYINNLLVNKGLWLYTDFNIEGGLLRLPRKMLVNIMYLFFKITANIETNQLIPMTPFFKKFTILGMKRGFILSAAYLKN